MNAFDLNGKVALVTGGTRGLGRSIALELARGGARVHAGYFQNEAGAEAFRAELTEQKIAGGTLKANLMTSSGVQAYFDHISESAGKLDCLIHNAATGVHKP